MWKTLAIIGAAYACIFILLMLGHLVYFVWNNYMDDFSDRFRASSKKNNVEHTNPKEELKNTLQKMGCKIEVICDYNIRVTFRDSCFDFNFDGPWLSVYFLLKCIPDDRTTRRLANEWAYEVNSTGNNVRVLVSDNLEEFCLDLWTYVDIDIYTIPLSKKECSRFIKTIFSALVFTSQELEKILDDLLPKQYSEENSPTHIQFDVI